MHLLLSRLCTLAPAIVLPWRLKCLDLPGIASKLADAGAHVCRHHVEVGYSFVGVQPEFCHSVKGRKVKGGVKQELVELGVQALKRGEYTLVRQLVAPVK